ncbi:hypothetical protein EMCRGX_G028720, partial [Ephydatia muelleri]
IVRIFNLFITYGDTFLPNPAIYDDLYYELIRMRKVFDDIYIMGVKHSNGPLKEVCERLLSHIVNVRAISTHFVPKIDHWCTANEIASITPDQVLDVVRSNYDSLTLKLIDGLDHYDRYTEKPKETLFFTQLVGVLWVWHISYSRDVGGCGFRCGLLHRMCVGVSSCLVLNR